MKWKKRDLIKTPCGICRGKHGQVVFRRPDNLEIFMCGDCGFHFINPRPKNNSIKLLYNSDYFSNLSDSGIGYSNYSAVENIKNLQLIAEERATQIESLILLRGKSCLEIGCATGELSAALQKRGCEIIGVDLSKYAITQAKKRYPNVKFLAGDLEKIPQKKFDLIISLEVIEHLINLKGFVKSVNNKLKPGGALILSTPNLSCGKKLGFSKWLGSNSSFEHISFFDTNSLASLFKEKKYEILAIRTSGSGDIEVIAKDSKLRTKIRTGLAFLGILNISRKIKKILPDRKAAYNTSLFGHNLLVVFRKPEGAPSQLNF